MTNGISPTRPSAQVMSCEEIMPVYICKDCTMSCSSALPVGFTMEP